MNKFERKISVEERKQKIRERYKGEKDEVEVIPAREIVSLKEDTSHKRVAAYCRVSTDDPNQTSSFELQKNHYEEMIGDHPGWELVGIYADEGISGTSLAHREEFARMLSDCEAGKIDLIVTKSISRFARNTVDAIGTVRKLAQRTHPIGVLFETENLFTLNQTSEMILTVLSAAAQEESHTKSEIMNISIDHRFARGIFLTPELLGYDRNEDGELVVNADEAETVRVIYNLFLNGFSISDIGGLLESYSRKTKLGNTAWSTTSITQIIKNERHCGDILARKTFTPSFLNHKSKKNEGERNMYRRRGHHEAIVSRDVYNAANHLLACKGYAKKNRPLPVLSVVDHGILRGYVPIDKDWTGFSAEEYYAATQRVVEEENVEAKVECRIDRTGYQVVREQFFSTMTNPALTISKGKMRFNAACLKKFGNVEYVELLLNTVSQCIAIRPCDKSNPNAIHWGKLRDTRWTIKSIACRGLAKTLFDVMNWDDETKYRLRGRYLQNGNDHCMLFELDEPEMIRTEEIIVPLSSDEAASINRNKTEQIVEQNADAEEETVVVRKTIKVYPPEWADSFGIPINCIARVSVLVQEHYAKNWDVLRPASELEEFNVFTEDSLAELMREAEEIMKGWDET